MILLVIFSIHLAVASDEEPECWFVANTWEGFAKDMDLRIPSKIEEDTGYKVNMDEPVMAVQMEEKKDEASYILVKLSVEGKERPLCFKGHVKDQQVLSMKMDTKCNHYLRKCKRHFQTDKTLPPGFFKEFQDFSFGASKA